MCAPLCIILVSTVFFVSANQHVLEPTHIDFESAAVPEALRFSEALQTTDPAAVPQVTGTPNAPPTAASTSPAAPIAPVDYSTGCLDIPFAVCVGNNETGTTVFAASAIPKGLVGSWDFNDIAAQDGSGYMNAVWPPPSVGPGAGGHGNSAHFHSSSPSHVIKHHSSYSSRVLSVSFWVFVNKEPFGGYNCLFYKGTADDAAPGIYLTSDDRKIEVQLSTRRGRRGLMSKRSVPLHRWSLITYVQEHRMASLYINGILDSEKKLPYGGVVANKHPIYIGKSEWTVPLSGFMDNLRIYDRALNPDDIMAEASALFPGLHLDSVRFGCDNCGLDKARRKCEKPYHLCSDLELKSGALMHARAMQWLPLDNVKMWHLASMPIGSDSTEVPRAALCCIDDIQLVGMET